MRRCRPLPTYGRGCGGGGGGSTRLMVTVVRFAATEMPCTKGRTMGSANVGMPCSREV